jgi:hypothetical protein
VFYLYWKVIARFSGITLFKRHSVKESIQARTCAFVVLDLQNKKSQKKDL